MRLRQAAALAVIAWSLAAACASASGKPSLRFGADGRFKIVQFTDIHNDGVMDPRTAAAMGKIIDAEKPDLVVLTGDNVSTGHCATEADLREAIRQVALPMETRGVPWATVFGNHDNDGLAKLGVAKARMYAFYRAYPRNVNPPTAPHTYGVGNALLQIRDSRGKAAFGVWLLDSNGYASDTLAGQPLGGYDWIHASQIAWYYETSCAMERRLGHKLPALMFFHICLPEYRDLASSGRYTGERNEVECPSSVNSGLFAALLERGDVLGVYVGHDHANNYDGTWYGIHLGYGGSIGWAAYGIKSDDEKVKNRIRGARIFVIDERSPDRFDTRYLYAGSLP